MSSECRLGVFTRRHAIGMAGGLLAAVALGGLSGCNSSGDGTKQGFASDTEVKTGALTIYLVADDRLKRGFATSEGLSRVEDYFERYQGQVGREQVTFAIKYKSSAELLEMAEAGYPEGDAIIALEDTIELACEKGTLYGGAANTSMRKFTSQFDEDCAIFRKQGTSFKMPKADTLTGEDSEDGQISRMQNLPKFKGTIGVAPEEETEGLVANRVLARWGFYSEKSGKGGKYQGALAKKIKVFDSVEDLVNAVSRKDCDLGFGVKSMFWGAFEGVESIYEPAFGNIVYAGASLPNSENGGVARDFMEYVTRCV